MKQHVHVWHVEITDPTKLPEPSSGERYILNKVDTVLPEFNRFLYVAVGSPWQWYMRLTWTYKEWLTFLKKPDVETWVAYRDGTPLGYFELEAQGNSTEICYFGLLPQFVGQGYGKLLLSDAIHRAWQLSGKRVWLHTCNLDAPQALANYLARGFTVFKEEDFEDELPDEPLQPWHNARKPIG